MSQKISDILKKAYHKGGISKREYESGIKEIKKQREIVNKKMKTITKVKTVRIPEKEMILGEIKIIKDAKGPRVVFDTGKEQVPLNFDSDKVNFPSSLFYDALKMGNRYTGFGFPGVAPMVMPAQAEGEGTPINLRFSSSQSDQSQQTESSDSWDREKSEEGTDDIFKQDETIKEEQQPVNEEPQQMQPESQNQQNVQETPKPPEGEAQQQQSEEKYKVEAQGSQEQHEQKQIEQQPQETKPEEQQIDINVPGKTFGQDVQFTGPRQEQTYEQTKKLDEDVKLIDMKKEVPLKEKKKKEEKKKKKEMIEKEGGFIKGMTKIFKTQKKESREAKLERIAKENLETIKNISDSRKAIIKVAHVLKDFLEIKFEIQFSTTYGELIDILKEKKTIHDDVKKEIIGFFKKVNECEYAHGFAGENFSDFYKSARRIIEEMSD